ncbi:abnormal spindle-like microcephaly-associated protein homolog isoform X2 [Impatiens glandulifera]|uniref:abnormal spindle-like microcephaly-associated protein homolog isoform X2 n=1 Tax=Impatiens glandulifera TaxID=253017 RepID=UPI001FB086CF|nr:abnormal spindle-like microcephaly-associated protein homolog isoform X2 [Impatiens glandulifera]
MESERHQQPFPSPSQKDRFTFLKDVSNFKTPKRISHSQFFTAVKQTPKSFSTMRRPLPSSIHSASASRSKAARRLKAFELEQYKSSHRVQINKEKSLQSLAKSLTVWLNFLIQDPAACGCDVSKFNCADEAMRSEVSPVKGKRDIRPIRVVGVDKAWRSPKRQRGSSWRGGGGGYSMVLSSSVLKESLQDICSFDDLKDRMRAHMSLDICKEIFEVMEKVVKNIDERRLSMKPHCPLVTDVGMKEKALKVLMCYNSHWLRIGLYIIFGGDSLLPDGDISSDQEIAFLKLVIEKQFFSHVGLAKTYSYNKLVEGLYRPGYFEKLGSVILKRFLLLALILDRIKLHTCLSVKYGIDGLDGGSPLLFTIESKIKSSTQLVKDFLSTDAMHGEGSILAHLVIVGYKVSYQQNPLNEYDFKVKELFEDLQDGVRLCRVIQLLKQDSSILLKLIVPSDTQKKNLNNCGIALQYLKQAGVPQVDEDGEVIQVEDIVSGDKELTLSILWNIFVHLQLPLLLDKNVLLEEISKIRCMSKEVSKCTSLLDMLLLWIQAICDSYDLKINNFDSLVDGKAIWCLLDFYFRKEFHCSCPLKEIHDTVGETSIMSASSYTDAIHNFILSQKLTTLLGKFPEVLQVSDIIEHNGACSSQSVIILLVFLSLQLVVKKNMDQLNFHKFLGLTCLNPEKRRLSTEFCFMHSEAALIQEDSHGNADEDGIQNFKTIMAWWQNMAQQNKKLDQQQATITIQRLPSGSGGSDTKKEKAAKLLQSHFRGTFQRRKFLHKKSSVSFLQFVIRAWLTVKKESYMNKFSCNELQVWNQSEAFCRHLTFMRERHTFVKLKKSVSIIQHATRNWISVRHAVRCMSSQEMPTENIVDAAIVIQKFVRGWIMRCKYLTMITQLERNFPKENGIDGPQTKAKAASKIQNSWKEFTARRSLCRQNSAAIKIQSYYRGLLLRKTYMVHMQVAITIQNAYRCFKCQRELQQYKVANNSALVIQSHIRGWIARRRAYQFSHFILLIQSHFRGWITRKELSDKKKAATRIQSAFRCFRYMKVFRSCRLAVIEIQRFVRAHTSRRRLLGASHLSKVICAADVLHSRACFGSIELDTVLRSVLILQRWWRSLLVLKSTSRATITIQSHTRGWIARREANRDRHRIVLIQSYWRGYLQRKDSKEKLVDLRLRMQNTAANVDDSKRLINRLVAAVSELLSMKSASGILYTCMTLDLTTQHSQLCCERLVEAGAIDTLLKLIRSVSRSKPDQEILKYTLSTIRNLARYPHLIEILISSNGSIQTVFLEFLRNKEEGYFIASELLKKISLNKSGFKALRSSAFLYKRLNSLVEDLTRKAATEKRKKNPSLVLRDQIERRLKAAAELLHLITRG